MMDILFILIICSIGITTFGTIYHSILSRKKHGTAKALHQARMNIQMGILFLSIGLLQILTPGSHPIRLILIALICIVGLINLYYGIKRHKWVMAYIKAEPEMEKK